MAVSAHGNAPGGSRSIHHIRGREPLRRRKEPTGHGMGVSWRGPSVPRPPRSNWRGLTASAECTSWKEMPAKITSKVYKWE